MPGEKQDMDLAIISKLFEDLILGKNAFGRFRPINFIFNKWMDVIRKQSSIR